MAGKFIDIFLIYQFIRRLVTPFEKWDAYKLGIIDKDGKVLRRRDQLKTVEEKDAFRFFDILVLNLKKLLAKIPGGSSAIATYAAALLLLKEYTEPRKELTENTDLLNIELVNQIRLVREQGMPTSIKDLLEGFAEIRKSHAAASRQKRLHKKMATHRGFTIYQGPDGRYHWAKGTQFYGSVDAAKSAIDRRLSERSHGRQFGIYREDAPVNAVGDASNMAGLDDNPPGRQKKKKRMREDYDPDVFAGARVFDLDTLRFQQCRLSKRKYTRYENYVGNDEIGETIRQYGLDNPRAPIVVRDQQTGAMCYLRYGGPNIQEEAIEEKADFERYRGFPIHVHNGRYHWARETSAYESMEEVKKAIDKWFARNPKMREQLELEEGLKDEIQAYIKACIKKGENVSAAIRKAKKEFSLKNVYAMPNGTVMNYALAENRFNTTAYQSNMNDNRPVIVQGVRGLNSKEFRRRFPNQKAAQRWIEKNSEDIEVTRIYNE